MNMKMKQLSLAVVQAIAFGVGAGIATSAVAQTPAPTTPPAAASEKIEKIEVTGSRISTQNLESISPVTVIDAATIKQDGLRSVENLLNNLPQVFANQGGSVSNGSTGTATVDLRGLGPNRTLVLVNGRRLPQGTPGTTAADLNQIPVGLIKRIEVLTGGAGAIYGSDAVAGVVNFIMNDKFEGVELQFNQNFYNHSQQNPAGIADVVALRGVSNPTNFQVPGDKSADGKVFDASLLLGSNFANGKGNATAFFSYKKENALLQSERDFSACTIGSTATGFACSGSSTSFPGRFLLNSTGASYTVADANGNSRRYVGATDQYNFGPTNFFQRPSERYTFAAYTNYDLRDNIRLYTEFNFHDDRTIAQIAPGGIFFGTQATINYDNPLLTDSWRQSLGLAKPGDTADITIGRRNVEGGGRNNDIRNTSFRTVVGLKGDFATAWSYDAFLETAKVTSPVSVNNYFSSIRIANALDVVANPNGGAPVCRSVVTGTDPNCVPYNLWRLGGVTPAALAYLQTPGLSKGTTEQATQGVSITGDLGSYGVKLPSAKNGIGVAFGAERRTEKLDFQTDAGLTSGDLSGTGGPAIGLNGKYTVTDIFTELRAPLIEGKSFAELLSVNASYRNSDYSTNIKTNTYGLGVEWAPVKQAKLRTSYQQAVRAPNLVELFTAQGVGLFNGADPCEGPDPVAANRLATPANCARTGVTAAQYGRILTNTTGQYNALFGGNPNLKPEKAKTYSVGLVLEPMKNLSMTIDYFNIKVDDTIGTIPQATVLAQCLAGNTQFCGLIQRDSLGTLWVQSTGRITSTNLNVGALKTSGIDLALNYNQKLSGWGNLITAFNGTYLQKLTVEPTKGVTLQDANGTPFSSYDCVKLYGSTCGNPNPQWRHKLRFGWATPWNVDASVTWRYFGKVTLDATSDNPYLNNSFNEPDRVLGARNYFDLSATWNVTKQLSVLAGVNNVLDKDPPVTSIAGAPFGNGNTYPQVYDALGRRIFLNATFKF
jgi:iron complex outermembrane recepter protein